MPRVDSPIAARILEREEGLTALHRALAWACSGAGQFAVVTAEAGGGKTTLVRTFLQHVAGDPLILRGACDAMDTPATLGSLLDAAASVDANLVERLVAGVSRADAFTAALGLIDGTRSGGRPTVFVIEDAHWADETTIDMLGFLGRRVHDHPALLVVTFRDDEVGPDHPLRRRLGDLGSAIGTRIHLQPLTPAAVAEMVTGSGWDAADIHRRTGGNPFFVSELLAGGSDPALLPASVADAVLARASRLSPTARADLDVVSVVPSVAELWLIDEAGLSTEGIDECLAIGMLVVAGATGVAFRHELAREAVEGALPLGRRREFHARILTALARPRRHRASSARLAHHAIAAGEAEAILQYAPAAARDAAALGGHREAAALLTAAADHAHLLLPTEHARLLIQLAEEFTTIAMANEALEIADRAADLARAADEPLLEAEAVVASLAPLGSLARLSEVDERTAHAKALAVDTAPSQVAALIAVSELSAAMVAREFGAAHEPAIRAMAMATELGNDSLLAHASIQFGISVAMSGEVLSGLAQVRRGIEIARRCGQDTLVTLGLSQIGTGCGEMRRYDLAVPALNEGVAFAAERELLNLGHYSKAWLARCLLEQGHWDDAGRTAERLSRNPDCAGIARFVALVTLGWLRTRRGDPDAWPALDEALDLARLSGQLQRMWPVAACRAEAAWIAGRLDSEMDLVIEVAQMADRLGYRPAIGELAHWRAIGARQPAEIVTLGNAGAVLPFELSAAGRHAEAAAAWDDLGCPYEAAVALLFAGAPDDLRDAFVTFGELGALPLVGRTVHALRQAGLPVPRGAVASTRANPFSLTDRELDVLAMLASGRTNAEIGTELSISTKTVGHHVSRLLSKIGARSRVEAAVVAERLGLGNANTPPR